MEIPGPLERAVFLERPNRFVALVETEGDVERAHVPNPGRLRELLVPGAEVLVRRHAQPERRTDCDLVFVPTDQGLVSMDARLPPRLLQEALGGGRVRVLGRPQSIEQEVTHGTSRFDLRVATNRGVWWVETKSCTLVERGVALFPDAPTTRGARHARELAHLAREGMRTALIFVIQRAEARLLRPFEQADPDFAAALRAAADAGVAVHAYSCTVSLERIAIRRKTPVVLD